MVSSKVKILSKEPLKEAKFVKASRLKFELNSKVREWEVVKTHDSVAVLIYNKQKDSFVLVKQFRPAVYLNNYDGYTVELCAGIIDKNKPLINIIKEEILEECGYDVPINSIEKITSFYTAVGFSGGKQTLYYVEVNDEQKVGEGGGIDDEDIEIVYLKVDDCQKFIFNESIAKTPGLMFAFFWFLNNKI